MVSACVGWGHYTFMVTQIKVRPFLTCTENTNFVLTPLIGYNGDGPALTTQLNYPSGLALDQAGDLIIGERGDAF